MHVIFPKPRTLLGDMQYLMHVVIPKPRTLLGDMHWPRLACDATMQHQWTN
ncbi:hypothetical protein GGE50_004077 [Rhizobium leguminosarum]|nr:hypothetical protein [Rhizobium leguminosarum]MDH6659205.1 hypothetical protein [Rhizobium sophorae]MBB4467236.1 hypothetical protein [Rhizobium leguminosarum]MBB4473509.1 hypothetical protein [Rhizobium leguminosarum]MBB4522960.1 hypothetical protein [Rhizobium leguminosarum]